MDEGYATAVDEEQERVNVGDERWTVMDGTTQNHETPTVGEQYKGWEHQRDQEQGYGWIAAGGLCSCCVRVVQTGMADDARQVVGAPRCDPSVD